MITDIKAVLFDLDDTLFDRRKAQEELLHIILEKLPSLFNKKDEATILSAFLESGEIATREFNTGLSITAARTHRFHKFLQILGLDTEYSETIEDIYLKAYPSINTAATGAKAVIERLSSQYQLGIISNGSPDVQYPKLEKLGVAHLLGCVVLSEEAGIKKPDVAIFQKAVQALNREPLECLYIGDSYENDILGAKKAGMKACWFNPNHMMPPTSDIQPDMQISSLVEIWLHLDCVKVIDA